MKELNEAKEVQRTKINERSRQILEQKKMNAPPQTA